MMVRRCPQLHGSATNARFAREREPTKRRTMSSGGSRTGRRTAPKVPSGCHPRLLIPYMRVGMLCASQGSTEGERPSADAEPAQSRRTACIFMFPRGSAGMAVAKPHSIDLVCFPGRSGHLCCGRADEVGVRVQEQRQRSSWWR